tara:strand:+ start:867 stop:1550 length:684 start_codon:yes stop_codon:yes gene_type:complete
MTRAQMHAEFKLLVDKGDSFDAPSFLIEEIDHFLNISQEKFVSKRAFGNNVRRTGFEEDQKRRDDLRSLIVGVQMSSSSSVATNKPNGRFVTLPDDYRHSIQEEAYIRTSNVEGSGRRVSVKPITHDRYNKIMDDPFNKPGKDTVYRLDYGGSNYSNIVELITGEDQYATDYYIRYIRHPLPIGPEQDCILPNHTHNEIVKMAVVEALENVEQPRYQTSKIELNEIE